MKSIKKKLLSKTLGKHSYWTLNKQLVKTIGLEATLILQHIIDLQSVFDKDEVFQSQSEMADELGISEYAIKNRIPELVKLGLVNVIRKGVPCKNYYSTNDDKILDILVEQLDDTKSTNLLVDLENNSQEDIKSTIQLASNQLTSEYEIDTTITNNTDKEYKDKEYNNKNTSNDKIIAIKKLDKLTEYIDDNHIPAARKLLDNINYDYGSFDNILYLCYSDDEVVLHNWKNYYSNTLQFITDDL